MAVAPKLENARGLSGEESLVPARPVRFADGIDLSAVRSART
jgi:hypothetical protein